MKAPHSDIKAEDAYRFFPLRVLPLSLNFSATQTLALELFSPTVETQVQAKSIALKSSCNHRVDQIQNLSLRQQKPFDQLWLCAGKLTDCFTKKWKKHCLTSLQGSRTESEKMLKHLRKQYVRHN